MHWGIIPRCRICCLWNMRRPTMHCTAFFTLGIIWYNIYYVICCKMHTTLLADPFKHVCFLSFFISHSTISHDNLGISTSFNTGHHFGKLFLTSELWLDATCEWNVLTRPILTDLSRLKVCCLPSPRLQVIFHVSSYLGIACFLHALPIFYALNFF